MPWKESCRFMERTKFVLRLEEGAKAMPMQVNQATEPLYIVKPFSGGGVARLFSTHPPIEERVRRLRQMRPALG